MRMQQVDNEYQDQQYYHLDNGNNTIYEDSRENLSETLEGQQLKLKENLLNNTNLEDSIENGRVSQHLSSVKNQNNQSYLIQDDLDDIWSPEDTDEQEEETKQ